MVMHNFLVIAVKAGTTSLYEYLKQHPQIWMSPVKETVFCFGGENLNFVDRAIRNISTGFFITKIEDYLNVFQGVSNQVAIGEVSPVPLQPKSPCASDTTYQTRR